MDVLMPQLGETVAEGKITKWFKSAGDAVKAGDNLFEIETDKVSMEVPSITAGVLAEIRVPAGEVAPVGAMVAVIADGAGAAASRRPPPLRLRPHPRPRGRARRRARPSPRHRRHAARRAAGSTDRARSVLRGAHAGAQLRPGAIARRHPRHAPGAPARGGSRHRPRRYFAFGPARPHRRARCRGARTRRRRSGGAARCARGASAPTQVKALYRDVPFEEVPLDGMRATIARAAGRGEADHPALLPDRRCRDRTRCSSCARRRMRPRPRTATAVLPSSCRSTTSSSRPGARAAARAGGERGVGAGPHPAVQAFRHRRRGRDRGRAAHAGDPPRRS